MNDTVTRSHFDLLGKLYIIGYCSMVQVNCLSVLENKRPYS